MSRAASLHICRTYLASVRALTALLELRNSAQVGHARQVADLSRSIAHAMALDYAATRDLSAAALLHDVAHIGLSDAVLETPLERLSDDESQRYRLHPVLGEQAALAGNMPAIAPLIRSHHERWDGQGFPDGLRGPAIPLGARILAVADAYEDFRGGRLDGVTLSPEAARDAVVAGRGSRFDPAVVDAFASLAPVAPLQAPQPRRLRSAQLRAGQTLTADFTSHEGVLLLSAGQKLDEDLIERIRSFERRHGLVLTIEAR